MESSKREIIWVLASYVIVLLIFIFAIDYPLFLQIKKTSEVYLEAQKTLSEFYMRNESVRDLQRDYEENQTDITGLDGIFINPDQTIGFITDLERIAQYTGNVFEIKSASSVEEEEDGSFLSFSVTLKGNFKNLIEFLANLEDSPFPPYRLIEIENINIERVSITKAITQLNTELSVGDLETTLNIKAYMR